MNRNTRLGAVVLSLACALLTAGCSPKTLDFRNVTVSNGKIYQGDANDPFSGKVTNVPDAELLRSQGGFRILAQRISGFAIQHGHRADRALLRSSLCDVLVSEGVPDGKAICQFPETKTTRFHMAFKHGALHGPFKYHQPNEAGALIATAEFKAGVLDGREEIFDLATERKVLGAEWSEGKQVGRQETYYPDTGALLATSDWQKGAMHGEWINYARDGKRVTFKANFLAGAKSGIEEHFDPATGTRTLHGEWEAGKRTGEWTEWDAGGKLRVRAVWRQGVMTEMQKEGDANPDSVQSAATAQASPLATCIELWSAAHRKGVGPDAAISSDQLREWEVWCKDGKRPGP